MKRGSTGAIFCLLLLAGLLLGTTVPIAHANFAAAEAALQEGEYEAALAAYREALPSATGVDRQQAQLKLSLLMQGLRNDARDELRAYLRAFDARAANEPQRAIELCNALLDRYPRGVFSDDALNLIAYIHLVDTADYAAANETYARLLADSPNSNYVDSARFGQAVALEKYGDYSGALDHLTELKDKHTMFSVGLLGLDLPRDNFLSRFWFNRATSKIKAIERQLEAHIRSDLNSYQPLIFAMGANLSYDMPVGSQHDFRYIWQRLDEFDVPATHVTHWITRKTSWRWESSERLQAAIRAGYTPIIVDWYFGDDISPDFVRRNEQAYYQHLRDELLPLLRGVPEVMVVLEPEFNKQGVEKWPEWDRIATRAINIIKDGSSASVGLGVGDWAELDVEEPLANIRDAAEASDFVAFLMMTSREYEATFTSATNDLGTRLDRIVPRLAEIFDKPLFLAYTAISSAGDWESRQGRYLRDILERLPLYADSELMGMGFFSLLDSPRQEGWFGQAETRFGLLDNAGRGKPATDAWRTGVRALLDRDEQRPSLVGELSIRERPSGAIELSGELSEWAQWTLTLTGNRSHARFEVAGSGSRIYADWQHLAQNGAFAAESVSVSVTARDLAGNQMRLDEMTRFEYDPPSYPQPASLDLATIRAAEGVQLSRDGEGTRLHFGGKYQMARLPASVPPAGSVEALEFDVRLSGAANGLYLGIENGAGVRRRLLLDGYLRRDADQQWQRVRIPLNRLLNSRARFDRSGRAVASDEPAPWTALVIENGTTPIDLELRSVSWFTPA
ncbi:MAG: hypothetical protein AAF515_21925 [Pseudomonadota bacterium]